MASLINYGSSDEEEEEAIVEGVNNYSVCKRVNLQSHF